MCSGATPNVFGMIAPTSHHQCVIGNLLHNYGSLLIVQSNISDYRFDSGVCLILPEAL
jgi:hypothetical protein